jgi:hypothetical protein
MTERAMTMANIGRLAGGFWLLNAVATFFSLGYVRPKLMVAGDAAATAANIVALEPMFRAAIASNLLSHVFLLLLALTLYHLFREAHRPLARVLLASMVIAVAIAVTNTLNTLGALAMTGQAQYLQAFTAEQRNAMTMVFLRLNNSGQALLELFWAPFYIAFGLLVIKSRYLPRTLGVLLIAMGFGFLINTLTKILSPGVYSAQFTQLAMFLGALGGVPTMFWLLIKGADTQPRRSA